MDWLQTFGDGDPEDSSSGPAVLFQVLKMRGWTDLEVCWRSNRNQDQTNQTGCFTVGQVLFVDGMIPLFLMQVLSDVTLQKARSSASSPNDDVFF